MPVDLKIDWASHKAAKFACENWHYSESVPVGKLVKVGVWEDQKFIGVVLFGRGANNNMLRPYGLKPDEGCELVRVALKKHKTPVSRIMAIALKFLCKQSPTLQLVVSYADSDEGHHGGIYQATNWIYTGLVAVGFSGHWKVNGKFVHSRTMSIRKLTSEEKVLKAYPTAKKIHGKGKHRYLMPLNKTIMRKLKKLAKPYPKRAGSVESDTPTIQVGEGGATPTSALQLRQHNV